MNSNLSLLLIANLNGGLVSLIAIICVLAGIALGYIIAKNIIDKKLKETNSHVKDLLETANKEAERLRKEALLEAKEEQHKLRNEVDKECKVLRLDLQKQEQRLDNKEEALARKEQNLDRKSDQVDEIKARLEELQQELDEKKFDIDRQHETMIKKLEEISKLTAEEAKDILLEQMLKEARIEAAQSIKEIEQKIKDDANEMAKEVVAQAVQRCAVEYTAEITSVVVELPNEEMKGRLIGRSGRNIKSIENETGVDVIIDDTPDVITLSCFEPVRREVAKRSIEKLILDGRIHPSKIEETVKKMRVEVENDIKKAGEDAVFEAGLYSVHPELIKIIGRMKYRTSYGQNMLKHAIEVSYIAGIIATELGADVKVARRGAFLHDVGKALDHEMVGTHVQIGVDLAKKYKESPEVIHCIEAHHNDVEMRTVEAMIVQAADAISGARPGARRESLENYIKRLEKLEEIAKSFDGVEESYAIQAGREIRVVVKPDKISDEETTLLARDIAKKLEEELEYPGQIKVNVLRELRVVEYAK